MQKNNSGIAFIGWQLISNVPNWQGMVSFWWQYKAGVVGIISKD